jgi:undecaprenyl diphosphate synthase
MVANGIRFRRIGQRQGLPESVLDALDETEKATADGTGLTLCLAVNYGSRAELTEAVRAIATRVAAGEIAPDAIDEAMISASLYTAGLPDPDLLIRTAGERRLSNYLLWQISYAEIHVSEALWPDFGPDEFRAALSDFATRERRYGDIHAL